MDNTLSLEYSDKKTPFIEMCFTDKRGNDSFSKLIFSKLLKTDHGYKWLCYVRRYENIISIKTTSGDRKKVTIPENDNIVYTFKLYRDVDSSWGVKKGSIPKKIQKFLRKTFEKLGVEHEGVLYFPSNKLDELSSILEKTDFDKIINPAKKKGKKRGKGRPKKIDSTN